MKTPPKSDTQLTLLVTPVARTKRGQVIYFGDYAKPFRLRRRKPAATA